jgi:hypothetical protein
VKAFIAVDFIKMAIKMKEGIKAPFYKFSQRRRGSWLA